MKKSLKFILVPILFIAFFLFLSVPMFFQNSVRASASSVVDFDEVTKFSESVASGKLHFTRIYFSFNNPVFDGGEERTFNDGNKVVGVTDKIYINARTLDEHLDAKNHFTLRFYHRTNGIDCMELRYYDDSAEKLNLVSGVTSFSIDAGFDTGFATLEDGVTAVYNGSGVSVYRDSTCSGLKNLTLKNFKSTTANYSGLKFSNENQTILSSMIEEAENKIKSAKSCVDIMIGGCKMLLNISDFVDTNVINPISIVKIEKAYQYPNKDISFKVFVDKNYSDNWYSHVTLSTDNLEEKLGNKEYFYTKETIEKLARYNVRQSILKNLFIGELSVEEIVALEGDSGIEEPVRVDYEIGNEYTNYYCFTVYLDNRSQVVKNTIKDLNDLDIVIFKSGFRLFNYTIDKDYIYAFDNSSKKWELCSKDSVIAKRNELNSLDKNIYSEEYNNKVSELIDELTGVINNDSASAQDYMNAIIKVNNLLRNKTYKSNPINILFESANLESHNKVYGYTVSYSLSQNITVDDSLFSNNTNKILLNDNVINVSMQFTNGKLVLFIPATLLSNDENIVTVKADLVFNQNYCTQTDYSIKYNNGVWVGISNDIKTYIINVVGNNVSVNGNTSVNEGDSTKIAFDVNDGYKISSVYIDGVNKGILLEYEFKDVKANHNVQVFTQKIVDDSNKSGCSSAISTFTPFCLLPLIGILFLKKKKNN